MPSLLTFLLYLQSLYESMDDVKTNKADKVQVEVEVREVSIPIYYMKVEDTIVAISRKLIVRH